MRGSTEKRDEDEYEPGAAAGGRVGGCPKNHAGSSAITQQIQVRAGKNGGGEEDGASPMEDARININTPEETVSMRRRGATRGARRFRQERRWSGAAICSTAQHDLVLLEKRGV